MEILGKIKEENFQGGFKANSSKKMTNSFIRNMIETEEYKRNGRIR